MNRTIVVVAAMSADNPSGNTLIEAKDFDPEIHELIDESDAEVVEAAQKRPVSAAFAGTEVAKLKLQLDEQASDIKTLTDANRSLADSLELAEAAGEAAGEKAAALDLAVEAIKALDKNATKPELQAVLDSIVA